MELLQQFYPEELPYNKLATFGISADMLNALPKDILNNLLSGHVSPRISVKVPTNGGVSYEVPLKLQLQRVDTGDVEVLFIPTIDNTSQEFTVNMMGTLPLESKEALDKGLATVAYLQIDTPDGGIDAVRCFVQFDKEQRQLVHVPTQVIGRNIKAAASRFNLSLADIDALLEGKRVSVEVKGKEATLGVDIMSEYGLLSVEGGEDEWIRAATPEIPKYSFGESGCWVNTGNGLKFVEEKDFTQEIRSMLTHDTNSEKEQTASQEQALEPAQAEVIEEAHEETQVMQR